MLIGRRSKKHNIIQNLFLLFTFLCLPASSFIFTQLTQTSNKHIQVIVSELVREVWFNYGLPGFGLGWGRCGCTPSLAIACSLFCSATRPTDFSLGCP
jgi:hypothetical protein